MGTSSAVRPRPAALAAVLAAAAVGLAACTSTVSGLAQVDPAAAGQDASGSTAGATTGTRPTTGPPTVPTVPTVPTPAAPSSTGAGSDLPLVDAGLPDDCLLTGAQLGALAGVAPMTGEQTSVTQSDGQVVDSCFYTEAGSFVPKGRIQVYRATTGTGATALEEVRGTEVPGVGDRAVLVRSGDQNLVWVAVGARVVTIRLTGGLDGSAAAFAAAGTQAVAALATR